MNCIKCGRKLLSDDIGAYKKFVNRNAKEYKCTACIAQHLKIDEEELKKKIAFLTKHGCMFFN